MKGKTQPRIYTEPLRKLTKKTSLGYMFNDFCEAVGQPLLPWQKWLSVHALEIVGSFPEDWVFRFRHIIVLVSRQNGKTNWFKLLGLFFNYVLQTKLVIGTAQNLDKANDTFEEAFELIEQTPMLDDEFEKALRGAGKREYVLKTGERWKVVATNRRARGWSSDLILMDELREQTDWDGWSAVSKTMLARPSALLVSVSNAGDETSVVLRHLREEALQGKDDSLGLFEWSAEDDCEINDKKAWAQANPSLGYGFLTERALESAMKTDPEQIFRTECLCQWVQSKLPPPFPEGAWEACLDERSIIAAESDLFWGIDLSQDRKWTTIGVCGLREDGNWHVEIAARRTGTEWALDWFRERQSSRPMKLAFQSRGAPVAGLAEQICTLPNVERIAIEGSELPSGFGRFWDAVAASEPGSNRGGVKIYHLPQPVLDQPAKTAQIKQLGGGAIVIDRTKSPDDAAPLIAVTMAFTAATMPRAEDRKKIFPSAYSDGHTLVMI